MGIQQYAKQQCPALCENIGYDIRVSKIGENAMAALYTNQTIFYARYASHKVKMEEEYLLMGANAIISATGGSLGLFLGFSCFGAVWKILELLRRPFS